MTSLRFTLRAQRDDEAVSADDFSSFLASVLACLKSLEDETGVQTPVEYKVVDLEMGSAAIELQPLSSGDRGRSAEKVAHGFEEGFEALQKGAIRSTNFTRKTKSRFIALAKPLRKNTRTIEFRGERREVVLSRRSPVKELPAPKTEAVARGSLKGDVDALNVHAKRVFYIYPRSGPTRVRCTFDAGLLDDLRQAIKRNTTVFGLKEYQAGSAFPTKMYVERVEVNPPDSELPTLESFWGSAPGLTGGLPARDYLDSIRDE